MENQNLKHRAITNEIIKGFYSVYNELGYGFLEKVYENSMAIELSNLGLMVAQQVPIEVTYKEKSVGHYEADLVVNELVIVELKAAEELTKKNEAQLLNYLKATRFEVGLLLNFGPEPRFRRKVFDNARKGNFSWVP
ncbi:MAG: GxxExxY protein [Chloroflexi bacterium]|nr:GxxExxY protein [Chloroflexota bacterium]MBI3742617.1 GxxExxY protein [Chloroflexota bacterium]